MNIKSLNDLIEEAEKNDQWERLIILLGIKQNQARIRFLEAKLNNLNNQD